MPCGCPPEMKWPRAFCSARGRYWEQSYLPQQLALQQMAAASGRTCSVFTLFGNNFFIAISLAKEC